MVAMTALVASTTPASAYQGNNYGWHDGPVCGWDGTHEHWDSNSYNYDNTGGATGIQYGYDDYCDRTQLKISWEPYYEGPRLSIWYGNQGVNPGAQPHAEFLYYTDHNVREDDGWHGFRLNH